MLKRLKRYANLVMKVCPFCLMNPSLGFTSIGPLGCCFCQKKVDDYMSSNYVIKKEE